MGFSPSPLMGEGRGGGENILQFYQVSPSPHPLPAGERVYGVEFLVNPLRNMTPTRRGKDCHNFVKESFYCMKANLKDLKYIIW